MIIRKIKILIMIILLAAPIYCQTAQDNCATKEFYDYSPNFQWRQLDKVLPEQENLVFDVYWKFVKVGKGTLEIKGLETVNGRKAYHIYSQAKSAPFFDTFFKVRDTNESWLDTESLCSLRYFTNISEGGWKKYEQLDFNHENKQFARNDDGTMKYGDTVRWVQDVISSFYYIRTMDLKVGDEYVFDAHSGDDTWPLRTKVVGKEIVKVKAGTFDCLILEPSLREDAGLFKAKGKLKVWVTNDDKKMPVKMKSKIPVGSISAELSTYKNNESEIEKDFFLQDDEEGESEEDFFAQEFDDEE